MVRLRRARSGAGVDEVITTASGTASPAASKTSWTSAPVRLSDGGNTHGSCINAAS